MKHPRTDLDNANVVVFKVGKELSGPISKPIGCGEASMLLSGVELLGALVKQSGFSAKMVLNETGAIFFPVNLQHRDQKAPNISYEDNYAGNALAAMLAPGRIEIRHHKDFSDGRVTQIVKTLLAEPRLVFMRGWQVTYQGRPLSAAE